MTDRQTDRQTDRLLCFVSTRKVEESYFYTVLLSVWNNWEEVMVVVLAIHWNACIYYQLSAWIGLGSDHWVYTPSPGTGIADHYFFCVYWSTMLLLTIGEMDHPVSTWSFSTPSP